MKVGNAFQNYKCLPVKELLFEVPLQVMECNSSQPLTVHIGNLAAISGVSRFLEDRQDWKYSKEENLEAKALSAKGFDRLLSEFPVVPGYHCTATVEGFQRLKLQASWPPVRAILSPQIYVLSRATDGGTTACKEDVGTKWNAFFRPEFQVFHSLTARCPP